MRLVQQIDVKFGSPLYWKCDEVAYQSKNLYNANLYVVRQHFFETGKYLSYGKCQKKFQDENQFDYRMLPAKAAQQTMKSVDRNFKSFFNALKEYNEHPEKFTGRPRLPKYLDTDHGRYTVVYTSQAISKKVLDKEGCILLSGTDIKIKTNIKYSDLDQVRIVKKTGKYVIEIVYTVPDVELKEDNGKYAAGDPGIDNLITLTFNEPGVTPVIIDGRYLKSINQYYNKRIAEEQSKLSLKHKDKIKSSNAIRNLYRIRDNRVNDYLHKASREVVNHLVSNDVCEIFIGHNKHWKQDINLGQKTNQNFMCIPYNKFISMIEYKANRAGIKVTVTEESYTSKASFLDLDEIPVYKKDSDENHVFSGYRKHRGLYKRKNVSGKDSIINADVNGSLNILRKCRPTAFANGVEGVVVRPVRYYIYKTKSKVH